MMTRSAACAALFGAIIGASTLVVAIPSALKYSVAPQAEAERAVADHAIEAWPICTTMGSLGANADWAQIDTDFAAGLKALAGNDWSSAVTALTAAALRDTRNADVQNYLGYAYRRLRQIEQALEHYQLAVMLNPRQRSAHEHLGEAYLVLGELAKAEEHLTALERICLIPCEQYADLRKAIETYKILTK
jgi:tetratricopeptide (TPR) repeat protein